MMRAGLVLILILGGWLSPLLAETPQERGYRLMRTVPYLPPDLTRDLAEDLWTVWPDDSRAEAAAASAEERQRMVYSYYGLMPADDGHGPALGYVEHRLPDGRLGWSMSCLACHGGKVAGQVMAGLPNSHYGLHTLVEDTRRLKLQRNEPLSHMDRGSLITPLGTTHGTTNAVIFGVALADHRTPDLDYKPRFLPRLYHHHDLDAPPFWNVKKKTHLYYDAAVPKGPRSLLQFMMIPRNSGERIRGWEDDAQAMLDWIESVEPPAYPGSIDRPLAAQGEIAFRQHCATCHGTYGETPTYPNRVVPIDEIGTDRARFEAITRDDRQRFAASWMGDYGRDDVRTNPQGYIAPPLDGIWASAPYLHNGSVPTLWHMLHPDQRPTVWQRTEDGYDHTRMGLEVREFATVPGDPSPAERRRYFDTRAPGKSAAGHTYPEALTTEQRRAVLEYLKTL